jgi:hypothetical protein
MNQFLKIWPKKINYNVNVIQYIRISDLWNKKKVFKKIYCRGGFTTVHASSCCDILKWLLSCPLWTYHMWAYMMSFASASTCTTFLRPYFDYPVHFVFKYYWWYRAMSSPLQIQGVYIIRWDFNESFLFHVAHRKYLPIDQVTAVQAANARWHPTAIICTRDGAASTWSLFAMFQKNVIVVVGCSKQKKRPFSRHL